MKLEEVDKWKLKQGEYCQKGHRGCFCKVGWPYERLCPVCRDSEGGPSGTRRDYCVCPPVKKVFEGAP